MQQELTQKIPIAPTTTVRLAKRGMDGKYRSNSTGMQSPNTTRAVYDESLLHIYKGVSHSTCHMLTDEITNDTAACLCNNHEIEQMISKATHHIFDQYSVFVDACLFARQDDHV